MYLFHELPAEAQRAAAKEMARVCKPGGLVILTDSTQLGDRREWDASVGNFGDFNEPWYRNYIATDLGEPAETRCLHCCASHGCNLFEATYQIIQMSTCRPGVAADARQYVKPPLHRMPVMPAPHD